MGTQLPKNKGGYLYTSNPKEELMRMLTDKTRAVGHMVTFKEASEDPDMVNPNNYAFYFGSYGEAAKRAWNRVKNSQPNDDTSELNAVRPIPVIHKPISDQPRNNFKLKSFARSSTHSAKTHNNAGRPREYTYEQIKDSVVAFYKEHGRFMTRSEVLKIGDKFPSWATICNYLGPKSKWLNLVPQSIRDEVMQRTAQTVNDFVDAKADEAPPGVTSEEKPIVDMQYHMKKDALTIELNIMKPGHADSITITLTV